MSSRMVVVLDDGETYGQIEGAVTMEVPEHVADAEMDEYVRERAPMEEPVVPLHDVLSSVKLALESDGLTDYAEAIIVTVEDYVTNHYGS